MPRKKDNKSGELFAVRQTLIHQREANAHLVRATIQAHQAIDEAVAARELALAREGAIRKLAEVQELFVGVMAHDLRNPLAAIELRANLMLRRGRLDEDDEKSVRRIIKSNQRMTRMITQLIELTRARLGGGLSVHPVPADLLEICQNVVADFRPGSVELAMEGDLTGTWDPDRLTEVFSNIAGNAVDYADPGSAVRVNARADGADVVVEISNRGPPIPPELLTSLFKPFHGGHTYRKSKSGHLGLGLYIAHEIVLAHGGKIDVRCAGGTTAFVVRLPRHCPARTEASRADGGGQGGKPGASLTGDEVHH